MSRFPFLCLIALMATGASARAGMIASFDFSERYQSFSLTGELVGLTLDDRGNATNVDPMEVLLYTVPPSVGITASQSQPYVFIPQTYEQYHEDPFTHVVSILTATTPGVFGFNVQGEQILLSPLDLTMVDSNQVNLLFNAGSFTTRDTPTYGITADGEVDYYWPTVDAFISYKLVSATSVPEPASLLLLAGGAAAVLPWVRRRPRAGRDAGKARAADRCEARGDGGHRHATPLPAAAQG